MSSPGTTSQTASHGEWAADDEGPEPFGQAGVRQYFGKAVAWCCVIVAMLAAAMWYRSTFFLDTFEWHAKDQAIHVRSVASRLIVDFAADGQRISGSQGWSYGGRYLRDINDAWRGSIWKTVGIEFSARPFDGTATAGFWLRVKWQFIVICMIFVPVARGAVLVWRRRREARE